MAQKTLTIKGKRFTAKQIAAMFDKDNMTNGDDYIITINGRKHYGNYRQKQDDYFAPVCDKRDANMIALMPDNGLFTWSIWLWL